MVLRNKWAASAFVQAPEYGVKLNEMGSCTFSSGIIIVRFSRRNLANKFEYGKINEYLHDVIDFATEIAHQSSGFNLLSMD
jgi:hypothetical protein